MGYSRGPVASTLKYSTYEVLQSTLKYSTYEVLQGGSSEQGHRAGTCQLLCHTPQHYGQVPGVLYVQGHGCSVKYSILDKRLSCVHMSVGPSGL